MAFFGCFKKASSFEDLLKHKKIIEIKEKKTRSKVNMRGVIRCNSPFVFIVGPPCVGKKKQAKSIAKKFGYVHFDVPDLVKQEAMQNTPRGRHVHWILMTSRNFPEFLHLDLLKEAMAQTANSGIKPPAWLVTGFPCLLQEAFMFEEEVGRVGLLVHLSGDIRLLLKIISHNYHERGTKIPPRLREHLIMFGEHLLPLLAAFEDRVEHVALVENEHLVFQELFNVMMYFDSRKPSNNRPTTVTQKTVERMKQRRWSGAAPASSLAITHELYLYSPYGPRSLWPKGASFPLADDQSLPDDESSTDDLTAATPTLAHLTSRRVSRPSMDKDDVVKRLKSLSISEDFKRSSSTKSRDSKTLPNSSIEDFDPSSESSSMELATSQSKHQDSPTLARLILRPASRQSIDKDGLEKRLKFLSISEDLKRPSSKKSRDSKTLPKSSIEDLNPSLESSRIEPSTSQSKHQDSKIVPKPKRKNESMSPGPSRTN